MSLLGDLSNITDPLDFKDTKIPKLFEVDSLLRCHICKEFLSAPMLTSCGHTFCSVCIRKYLIHTPKCPICAKELRESNLSRNVLLEQIVISYKSVRDDLLKNLTIPKEKEIEVSKTNGSGRSSNKRQEAQLIEDLDDYDYDDDVMIIEEPKKRKSEANGIDHFIKKQKQQPNKDEGICPICNKIFPLEVLQTTHIDVCLTNPKSSVQETTPSTIQKRSESTQSKSSTPSSPSPYFQPKENQQDLKKLTKLDYSSLSTSGLKQKLTKLELPVSGTRNQLEARYNEFLILWNANCDSVAPKNIKVLRKQLAQWEGTLKFKTGGDKQIDENGWGKLIAQAKKSALKGRGNDKEEEDKAHVEQEKKEDVTPVESKKEV